MSWTTPRTWASELITTTIMNAHIRDNLNALKDPPGAVSYVSARDYQIDTSGAWSNVDTGDVDAHFRHTLTVADDTVTVRFVGQVQPVNNVARVGFGVSVDGTQYFPASGIAFIAGGNVTNASAMVFPVGFEVVLTGITAGSHTFRLTWFGTHTATKILATAGHFAMFSVKELP